MKRLLSVLLMPFFFITGCRAKIEEGKYRGYELPSYVVIEKDGTIEIRQYDQQLVAEVIIGGQREDAIQEGFRILASYIFGENESATKISMTSPVTQKPLSEKIAMTTPVTQVKSNQSWVIRFGMPKDYTEQTLPKSKDSRIHFVMTPANKRIAIMYSGIGNDANITENTQRLKNYITERNLTSVGDPIIAFYDDPFTLPWNRRNEIMWQIH